MTTEITMVWPDIINPFGDPLTATSTQMSFANWDGLSTTLIQGTGFTYNSEGEPTGGNITKISLVLKDSARTVLQHITGNLPSLPELAGWVGEIDSLREQITWFDAIDQEADPETFSFSDTQISFVNLDGTFTEINGTGFASAGSVLDGTIQSVRHLDSDGVTELAAINIDVSLADGSSAMFFGIASEQLYLLVTAGSNTHTGVNGEGPFIIGGQPYIIHDILYDGPGSDTFIGATRNSLVSFSGAPDAVVADLTTGQATGGFGDADTFVSITGVNGSNYDDSLTGNEKDNWLVGEDGNDTLAGVGGNDTLIGSHGDDTIDGGDGTDTVSYLGESHADDTGVTVSLALQGGSQDTTGAGQDILSNIENLMGSLYADTLSGDDKANVINGASGDDTIYGGEGGDILSGDTGDDELHGESGDDTLIDNEEGSIVEMYGGEGNDRFQVSPIVKSSGVIDGGDDFDTMLSVADISGLTFSNMERLLVNGTILAGTSQLNAFTDIRASADEAFVNPTKAITINLASTGTVDFTSNILSSVPLTVNGSADDDEIIGHSGKDTVFGGAGDDTIGGGLGNDVLQGGTNTSTGDTLTYESATGSIKVSLAITSAQVTGGAGTDTVSGFENLRGGSGNDTLTGSTTANIIEGMSGDDFISGGAGNDEIYGGVDNDILIGGAGTDLLYGGDDHDTASYVGSTAGVTINLLLGDGVAQGGAGDGLGDKLYSIENLIGSAKNDVLTGDHLSNVIEGGLGNDTLDGGAGDDWVSYASAASGVTVNLTTGTATGGAGTDKLINMEYVLGSNFGDLITGVGGRGLYGAGGNDILYSSTFAGTLDGGSQVDTASYEFVSFAVQADLIEGRGWGHPDAFDPWDALVSIENLTGSAKNDILSGDGGNNKLDGGIGDDTIEGRGGNDTLIGGSGIDTLSYEDATGGVKVSLALTSAQVTGGSGTDTISGFENLTGGSGNDTLTGTAGVNVIKGGDGNDTISGGAAGDYLYGDDGDDILIGGTGADKIFGGAGSDTASYATSALGVTVDLNLAVQSSAEDASGDQLDSIENLIGSAKADRLTGDVNDNVIEGGLGNDTLDGGANGAGGDTLSYASATAAVIVNLGAGTATGGGGTDKISGFENVIGGKGADTISGNSSANVLDGGAGIDTVSYASESGSLFINLASGNTYGSGDDSILGFENAIGGAGNDTIIGNARNNKLVGGDGTDTLDYIDATSGVKVSLALTSAQVTGGAGTDTVSGFENISGGKFNDTLTGDTGTNELSGLIGNDTLSGGGGSDTLIGGEGDDMLIGGTGADIIDGGDGNDTASYAGSTAGVTVNLNNTDQNGSGDESGDDLYDIENLIGSAKNDTLTGDEGDNVIEGGLGNDTLDGGAHGGYGDTASYRSATAAVKVSLLLQGGAQATGGGGTDILSGFENLEGGAGADTLTGDAGANVITGNAGNDIIDGGGGIDTLIGGIGSDTYLVDEEFDLIIEALNAGTDLVKSTASQYTLSANIENLTLVGTGDIDGTGNELANVLTGNSGTNILSGGSGDGKADTMKGGLGDDVYMVEAGDIVTELASQGTDWVYSIVSYTLASNVENLQLVSFGGAINGTGNTLANTIFGNNSANVLNGKAGIDALTGDGGADTFVFNTTLNATTNVDTIADFVVGEDLIHLENAIFTKVGLAGALSADAFWAGVAAHDATDRIIYDSSTGALYYDSDGTGAAAQVKFAVLENTPATITEADFLVI